MILLNNFSKESVFLVLINKTWEPLPVVLKHLIISGSFSVSPLENISDEILERIRLIVPNYNIKCNRALNSSKFKKITGYNRKNWKEMLIELRKNYLGNI